MGMIADWPSLAACRNGDPDALFVQGAEQNVAKRICRSCPVRYECLADASRQPDRVRGVGRHDRTRASRASAPAPAGGQLEEDVRSGPAPGGRQEPRSRSCRLIDFARRSTPLGRRTASAIPSRAARRCRGHRRAAPALATTGTSGWSAVNVRGDLGLAFDLSGQRRVDAQRVGGGRGVPGLRRGRPPRPARRPRTARARTPRGYGSAPGPAAASDRGPAGRRRMPASRIASGSGAATTRNAVSGACRILVRRARPDRGSRRTSMSSAATKPDRSAEQLAAEDLRDGLGEHSERRA